MSISFRQLIGEKCGPTSRKRTREAIRWRHAECREGATTSSLIGLSKAACSHSRSPDGRPVQQVDPRDVLITLSDGELYRYGR
jgi:hypothetical protein